MFIVSILTGSISGFLIYTYAQTFVGFFVCGVMGRFGYEVRKDIRRTNHDGGIRVWYFGLVGI